MGHYTVVAWDETDAFPVEQTKASLEGAEQLSISGGGEGFVFVQMGLTNTALPALIISTAPLPQALTPEQYVDEYYRQRGRGPWHTFD